MKSTLLSFRQSGRPERINDFVSHGTRTTVTVGFLIGVPGGIVYEGGTFVWRTIRIDKGQKWTSTKILFVVSKCMLARMGLGNLGPLFFKDFGSSIFTELSGP